eukprot:scaffold91609_cov20-Prasinocladus_malaysianus.AAC.1
MTLPEDAITAQLFKCYPCHRTRLPACGHHTHVWNIRCLKRAIRPPPLKAAGQPKRHFLLIHTGRAITDLKNWQILAVDHAFATEFLWLH